MVHQNEKLTRDERKRLIDQVRDRNRTMYNNLNISKVQTKSDLTGDDPLNIDIQAGKKKSFKDIVDELTNELVHD